METKINIPRVYLLLAMGIFLINIVIIVLDVFGFFNELILTDRFLNNYGLNFLMNSGAFSFIALLLGPIFLFVSKSGRMNKKIIIIGIILYALSSLMGSLVLVPY